MYCETDKLIFILSITHQDGYFRILCFIKLSWIFIVSQWPFASGHFSVLQENLYANVELL